MIISATEFKTNMEKYLSLVSEHVIYITKNGKEIAKLTSPDDDRTSILDSLVGIIPANENADENVLKSHHLNF